MSVFKDGFFPVLASPDRFALCELWSSHTPPNKVSTRLDKFSGDYPTLMKLAWDDSIGQTANIESILRQAREQERTALLVTGSETASILVCSLIALAEGFDVFICNDLISVNGEDDLNTLLARLKQQGVVIATSQQLRAEFQAVSDIKSDQRE